MLWGALVWAVLAFYRHVTLEFSSLEAISVTLGSALMIFILSLFGGAIFGSLWNLIVEKRGLDPSPPPSNALGKLIEIVLPIIGFLAGAVVVSIM